MQSLPLSYWSPEKSYMTSSRTATKIYIATQFRVNTFQLTLYSIGHKTCAEAKICNGTSNSCIYVNKGRICVEFRHVLHNVRTEGGGGETKQFRGNLRQLQTSKHHPNFDNSSVFENGAQGQGKKIHATENWRKSKDNDLEGAGCQFGDDHSTAGAAPIQYRSPHQPRQGSERWADSWKKEWIWQA